jgi:hypothetical protein
VEGIPSLREILKLIGKDGIPPDTSFDGVLEGEAGDLEGRSDRLLELLTLMGVLEQWSSRLHVERRLAMTLGLDGI